MSTSSTAIVWFRRDLRVHDHPALVRAVERHTHVLPLFVLDRGILTSRFASFRRTRFLLESLVDLDRSLQQLGAGLVVREGKAEDVIAAFVRELDIAAVYWASDVSPYAIRRDRTVRSVLKELGVQAVPGPGNFVCDIGRVTTQAGNPFTVFTPFWRAWQQTERRDLEKVPSALSLPEGVSVGAISALAELGLESSSLSKHEQLLVSPGESAARAKLTSWLDEGIHRYEQDRNWLAVDTSLLSAYLHFGCLSPRELELRCGLLSGSGTEGFVRQLAWRDFYAHVLLHYPSNLKLEFQPRFRSLEWDNDPELFTAWCEGMTGYPLVDAAMRQLKATGYMHNRARLVVGSFLTKDLHLDWRLGEQHFMRLLIDGDIASNNGNWQWIASVGVDPAPYFRRIFNPALQQEKFDPDGEYVRRWVPELAKVPLAKLKEPWRMSQEEQQTAGCVIGFDYPAPIVDHAEERRRTLERYRAVKQ